MLCVQWNPIKTVSFRGRPLGYVIFFGQSTAHDRNVSVSPLNNSALLIGLKEFTTYHVQVAAYNRKGLGPLGEQIAGKTDEDGES